MLAEIDQSRPRHTQAFKAQKVFELPRQRRHSTDGMPQRLRDVVLLPLQEHAHHAAVRALQFTPSHAAPAAAALVGFLEPFGPHIPEIIERAQAVLLEQRLPVWSEMLLHVWRKNGGPSFLWQQAGDHRAEDVRISVSTSREAT